MELCIHVNHVGGTRTVGQFHESVGCRICFWQKVIACVLWTITHLVSHFKRSHTTSVEQRTCVGEGSVQAVKFSGNLQCPRISEKERFSGQKMVPCFAVVDYSLQWYKAVLDLPGGLGGFDPQDKSLTPPAKVGQMYWGGGL